MFHYLDSWTLYKPKEALEAEDAAKALALHFMRENTGLEPDAALKLAESYVKRERSLLLIVTDGTRSAEYPGQEWGEWCMTPIINR